MLCIDETLDTVAQNLALDEALLVDADAGLRSTEVLRLWDARETFVVVGRGSRLQQEVRLDETTRDRIPVLRRVSGGASVVAAPGCLFYTVLLSLEQRPHLRMLDEAHAHVMSRNLRAVQEHVSLAALDGTCDIVLRNRKVSGNSLRVGREWLLYHGSLLCDMDLSLVERYLAHPPREPEYRQGRGHRDFLANLGIAREALVTSLQRVWQAAPLDAADTLPWQATLLELVESKYTQATWNASR